MADNVDLSAQFDMREQIGKGAFGSAFLVVHKDTKQQYVLKRIRLAKQTHWQRNSTFQERDLVSKLQHPYIVPHVASWITQGHTVNIVYGYCEKGDLATLLTKNNGAPFREATLKLWLCQMLLALEYLQVQKVLHRDIKTGNIFLTAAGDVQLGDFGLATYREAEGDMPEDTNLVGTPHYMSPELLSQKGYSFKSDTWSLGCVFYELTAQRPAFNAFNIHGLVTKIRRHRMAPLPTGYSQEWGDLIALMLRKDPDKRPSVQELMAHIHLRPEMEKARARALEVCPDMKLPPLLGPWVPQSCGSEAGESGGGGAGREGPSPRGSCASWTEEESASEHAEGSRRSSCIDADSPHSTPRDTHSMSGADGGCGSTGSGAHEAQIGRRASSAAKPRILMFDGETIRPDETPPHVARERRVPPGRSRACTTDAGSEPRHPRPQGAHPRGASPGGCASSSSGTSVPTAHRAGSGALEAANGGSRGAGAAGEGKSGTGMVSVAQGRSQLESMVRIGAADAIKLHVKSLQRSGAGGSIGAARAAADGGAEMAAGSGVVQGGAEAGEVGVAGSGRRTSVAAAAAVMPRRRTADVIQTPLAASGAFEFPGALDGTADATPGQLVPSGGAAAAAMAGVAVGCEETVVVLTPDLGAEAVRQAGGQAVQGGQDATPDFWASARKPARSCLPGGPNPGIAAAPAVMPVTAACPVRRPATAAAAAQAVAAAAPLARMERSISTGRSRPQAAAAAGGAGAAAPSRAPPKRSISVKEGTGAAGVAASASAAAAPAAGLTGSLVKKTLSGRGAGAGSLVPTACADAGAGGAGANSERGPSFKARAVPASTESSPKGSKQQAAASLAAGAGAEAGAAGAAGPVSPRLQQQQRLAPPRVGAQQGAGSPGLRGARGTGAAGVAAGGGATAAPAVGDGKPGSPNAADKQQVVQLKKALALAAALFAKGRFVELGRVLSSPGIAPASLLPQLNMATQRFAAAAAIPDGSSSNNGPEGAGAGSSGSGSGSGGAGASGVGGGAPFRLGESVVVGTHQRTKGIIRWFGPVAFDRVDVDYVGIQLELARGRHAGTVGGICYFDAAPGMAEFIRASQLVPNPAGGGPAKVTD